MNATKKYQYAGGKYPQLHDLVNGLIRSDCGIEIGDFVRVYSGGPSEGICEVIGKIPTALPKGSHSPVALSDPRAIDGTPFFDKLRLKKVFNKNLKRLKRGATYGRYAHSVLKMDKAALQDELNFMTADVVNQYQEALDFLP